MDENGIYNVLGKLEPTVISTVGEWVMCNCPFAEWRHIKGYDITGTNFGVHIEDEDISRYNCLSCHSTGTLSGLFFQLATLRDEPELREYAKKLEQDEFIGGQIEFGEWDAPVKAKKKAPLTVSNFPSERDFTDRYPSFLTCPQAIRYLGRRGISVDTAFRLGLRYDPKNFRILFPVYDELSGRFAGCSGRSIRSAKWREHREATTGKTEPKIRDYFGLQKDRLLLGSPRNRRGSGFPNLRSNRVAHTGESGPILAVEGLFAYGHIRQIRPRVHCRALLGSKLTEGKAHIFRVVNRPIYWLTDNDIAGRACLYGVYDKETDRYNPDDDPKKRGALDVLYGEVAQFVLQYPEGIDDPDHLTGDMLDDMIAKAELYIK